VVKCEATQSQVGGYTVSSLRQPPCPPILFTFGPELRRFRCWIMRLTRVQHNSLVFRTWARRSLPYSVLPLTSQWVSSLRKFHHVLMPS
jgi:hypothetical protein